MWIIRAGVLARDDIRRRRARGLKSWRAEVAAMAAAATLEVVMDADKEAGAYV